MSLIVRTQELGGHIVSLGTDWSRGIAIEAPTFQSDEYGPSAGSFTMKRKPRALWPDLRAYAPVIVEDGSDRVWLGRIKNTPMTDGGTAQQVQVNCEGQQFHLDDDAYLRSYVISDLSTFVDQRSLLGANLASFKSAYTLDTSGGALSMFLPGDTDGSSVFTYPNVGLGATIDTGPDPASWAKSIAVTWTTPAGCNDDANTFMYFRGHDAEDAATVLSEDISGTPLVVTAFGASGGPLQVGGTFATAHRYFSVFVWSLAGPGAYDMPQGIRITGVIIVPDSAYLSGGGTSALTADMVVKDALNRATLLLSSDQSLITATSFDIPELTMSSPQTPRQMIDTVNAYHGWRSRVRADGRMEFGPLPAYPSIEVGADSEFDEASAGDASQVYTDVIVNYTDPAGVSQCDRFSQPAVLESLSATQLSNGDFETNITGWTSLSSTLSQDTAQHNTGSHSLKIVALGTSGSADSNSWAGTFTVARKYVLTYAVRTTIATGISLTTLQDANGNILCRQTVALAANTWTLIPVPFSTQTTGAVEVAAEVYDSLGATSGFSSWLDSFTLTESTPTIVDRWGFKRCFVLDTNMSLTPAASQQIGTAFLDSHQTTPLQGTLTVIGNRAWRTPSGQRMRCSEFLGETGSLVRLAHVVDPDTGKLGRWGRIAAVTWDPVANTASISLDSTDQNFQALLSRMQVVTGQVRT